MGIKKGVARKGAEAKKSLAMIAALMAPGRGK